MISRTRAIWRRFCGDERGSYALEFGLCAIPFFGIIFAFVEADYVNFENDALQLAVSEGSRALLTGSAQANTTPQGNGNPGTAQTAAQFATNYICSQTAFKASTMSCGNLIVDVRTAGSFALTTSQTNNSFYNQPLQYTLGAPDCIMVVRVAYPLTAVFPLSIFTPHAGLVNDAPTNNGVWSHIILATEVFETEPYNQAGNNYSATVVSPASPTC